MDYSVKEVNFLSTDGSSQVVGWIYTPGQIPVGVLQISHGMCEYIGRYQRFIEFMTQQGFVVCGHDHIGHGQSARREQYGYFGERNGYQNLVADLHKMTEIVKKQYPNLPYFLFGHSMGSFISRLYLSQYSGELTGVILCGTGGPNPMANIGAFICGRVAAAKGSYHRSAMLDKMAFGSFNKKATPQRTDKDWLTRDNDIVDRYRNDPQCMFLFTAKGYQDLSKLSVMANRAEWYETLRKELPVFLIAGDMDPVGNYGKGVAAVFRKMQAHGMQDVSMKLYPGARHELLNEINYQEVQGDIHQWLVEHLPQQL